MLTIFLFLYNSYNRVEEDSIQFVKIPELYTCTLYVCVYHFLCCVVKRNSIIVFAEEFVDCCTDDILLGMSCAIAGQVECLVVSFVEGYLLATSCLKGSSGKWTAFFDLYGCL